MLIFLVTIILCSGFTQLNGAEEIERTPDLDFSSAPTRNVFLKEVHPKFQSVVRPQLRIVNGQTATRGQFCYQAFLQFSAGRDTWTCGGSLVTSQLVLTAAHCVQGAKTVKVILGGLDLSQTKEPGRIEIQVRSGLKYHEKYDTNSLYNDIAVVKLPQAVQLNEYICTIQLPSCSAPVSTDSDDNNYTVSGWGKTSDRTTSSKLMYVTVPGEPQSSCATYFKFVANYNVIDSQMCTSGSGKKSTCNGDSGGPLVQTDESGNVTQRGIVSLGLRSCEFSAPSVYTDLSYFMDWLCPQM